MGGGFIFLVGGGFSGESTVPLLDSGIFSCCTALCSRCLGVLKDDIPFVCSIKKFPRAFHWIPVAK